jgi:hypothetical protein
MIQAFSIILNFFNIASPCGDMHITIRGCYIKITEIKCDCLYKIFSTTTRKKLNGI